MITTGPIYPVHRLGKDTLSYRAFRMTSRPRGKWVMADGQGKDLVFRSLNEALYTVDLWYGDAPPVRRSGQ